MVDQQERRSSDRPSEHRLVGARVGLLLILLPFAILATCEFGCVSRTEIKPALAAHIEAMLPDMRQADIDEVEASSGQTIEQALTAALQCSSHAWTWFVDGAPVCMLGVRPISILGGIGVPWLLGTNSVERHQAAFLRRGRGVVARMLAVYPWLINAVDVRSTVSIRWLEWLGFHVYEEPLALGPRSMPFRLFEMRKPIDV